MELLIPSIPPLVRHRSGFYYPAHGVITGTLAPSENAARAMPFWLPAPRHADRIGVEVTSAGEAGSVVRLGIYADGDEESKPGDLIVDAGTIAGDGATGFKAVTISEDLPAGLVWLVVVAQSATTTRPTMRTLSSGGQQMMGKTDGLFNGFSAYLATIAGALPAAWSGDSSTTGFAAALRFT